MVPRKSATQSKRTSQSAANVASSSKLTFDVIPSPDIAESITSDYTPQPRQRRAFTEEERSQFIHELIGFHPATALRAITEDVRWEIYHTASSVEGWANAMVSRSKGGVDMEREVVRGVYALETLLETHVDKALDKFTAWTLRNAFDVRADHDLVLPWQLGLDFSRGEYVASLPPDTLDIRLELLRTKVEQARLLDEKLIEAERLLDRRLEIAKQRKAEVGFVKEILSSSCLSPLHEKSQAILVNMTKLHATLSPMETHVPIPLPVAGNNAKAWELGRQAYLNWAVGKMLPQGPGPAGAHGAHGGIGGVGAEEGMLEGVEREMMESGGAEGLDRLSRAV